MIDAAPPAFNTKSRLSPAPILSYFVLAYALTWSFWIPGGLQETGKISLPVPTFLMQLLGGFGPMLTAIAITAVQHGRAGVGKLFRQLLRLRVGVRWYALAFVVFPPLALIDPLIHVALGGSLHLQDLIPTLLIALPLHFVFVALVGGGLDEEMGWRGYALPQLQARMHPISANLLLGVLWSCWHLPLWFIPGTFQSTQSFPLYLLSTTALSFLLGLVYNGTGGSLLLVILAHAAGNASDNLRNNLLGTISPDQLTEYHLIRTALTVVVALLAVMATGGKLGQQEGADRS